MRCWRILHRARVGERGQALDIAEENRVFFQQRR